MSTGGRFHLSLPGEGTCVYFRTQHREVRTPTVGALARALAGGFAVPSAPALRYASAHSRSAASRNPTSSCWLRMHVPRVVDFYTGRMWYNTRMILKDDPKAYAIMGCAMRVHSILGYGFLESAYGDALEIEFKKAGIPYVREDSVRA